VTANVATTSKENVQVFTSLPPKVEGDIKCYLKLHIPKLSWLVESGSSDKLNRNVKQDTNRHQAARNIAVRCSWWGEDSSRGALFRPKVVNAPTATLQDPSKLQTTAKYMIRCGPKQFNSYLNGM
jgi:C2 domain-containing protein 3